MSEPTKAELRAERDALRAELDATRTELVARDAQLRADTDALCAEQNAALDRVAALEDNTRSYLASVRRVRDICSKWHPRCRSSKDAKDKIVKAVGGL